MLKKIIAVVSGTILSFGLLFLLEQVLCFLFPLPHDVDPKSHEGVQQILNNMPASSYVILLGVYAFSAFAGGIVATVIPVKATLTPALIVGGLLTASGIWDVIHTANPWWFSAATVLVFIPFAYFGYYLMKGD